MSLAICPGSFDPITLGHLDIISRSAQIFDNVIVCIMFNSNKTKPMFTISERVVIVKGLRAASDFEYEFQMNHINKKINPELETMFLTANEKYTFLSSSVVREVASYGADLTRFVPREIVAEIEEKAKLWRQQ